MQTPAKFDAWATGIQARTLQGEVDNLKAWAITQGYNPEVNY